MSHPCEQCGQPTTRRYCGRKCYFTAEKAAFIARATRPCPHCGTAFVAHVNVKFCSRKCSVAAITKGRTFPDCQVCGKTTDKYKAKFCSWKCSGIAKKGTPIPHIKKELKGSDVTKIEDGSIDAGMILLSAIPREWTHQEIAEVCGTSWQYINQLERSAMRKLRQAVLSRYGNIDAVL
jgi:endogenous inhibitor of DNA gyrase (YacG/DUF329 family)